MYFGCLWVYLEMPSYFHMLEGQKLTSTKDNFGYTQQSLPHCLTLRLHPQMPVNGCGV